jgi:hypothetical protein
VNEEVSAFLHADQLAVVEAVSKPNQAGVLTMF